MYKSLITSQSSEILSETYWFSTKGTRVACNTEKEQLSQKFSLRQRSIVLILDQGQFCHNIPSVDYVVAILSGNVETVSPPGTNLCLVNCYQELSLQHNKYHRVPKNGKTNISRVRKGRDLKPTCQ